MTPKKRRRLAFAIALLIAGGVGAALIVSTLQDNVLYFYSPSDIVDKHVAMGVAIRIGGLVEKKSIHHDLGIGVSFIVTDGKRAVPVHYQGVLPDLFREGQGMIALGALGPGGVFDASQVLAKHDERYMPPEVVDALKRAGRWKEGA
jgi:cytochrome c-type biogenesis protein CcmE